ncbi:SusC/RagA family TonB-linked outer membrane protein [Gelidibacter maritimus]|uniref:TonB-dependent receptor n=1 Tax=Gelidibacter maritimus TaxID=2761487 RepID=A0A7W2M5F9_9FLAO|nr:TonB-dependent receptor [Gelidibacter maritimus]MBA6152811.1 TonB-dependent receptor [Gelidibacter maritimus]
MKTFFLLCCTVVFALGPNDGLAQNANIVINSNQTLNVKQVFKLINKQTNYRFVYRNDLVNDAPHIIVEKGTIKTKDLLNNILTPIGVDYIFSDDTIIIKKMEVVAQDVKNTPLVAIQSLVEGVVTDADGMVLPGASILEKGTTNGVTADFDGKFSLEVQSKQSVLVISYMGFVTQEIVVGDTKVFNITMIEDADVLDEVVLVGYGTQKKVNVTSAISTVNTDDLGDITEGNIGAAIQGRAPGLYVRDAGYNEGIGFLIRGSTTIGNNTPLFIVDGVPQDALTIDPKDVKDISILKDGAASAIYGSRAAAGVVLITTKTGDNEKASFNYETYSSWSNVTTTRSFVNSIESARIMNEASVNSGGDPLFSQEQINYFRTGEEHFYANINWVDEILKTEFAHSHFLSAQGGSEKSSYYVSLGYRNADGIMVKNIDNTRYNLRANLNAQLADNLKLATNISYIITDSTTPSVNDGMDNIYLHANVTAPFMPIKMGDEEDAVYSDQSQAGDYFRWFNNPLWELGGGKNRTVGKNFSANLSLDWELFDGFHVQGNYSGIFYNQKSSAMNYRAVASGGPSWFAEFNNLNQTYNDNRQINAQTFLSYEKEIGDHYFNILGGWDVQFNKDSFLTAGRENFQFDDYLSEFDAPNSGDKEDITNLSSNTFENVLQSAVGRIDYNYAGKYLLTLVGRYDGASIFAPENRYGFFPAASAGWLISREDFYTSETVNYLKLRASYGVTGNNRVDGTYFSNILFGQYYFGLNETVGVTANEAELPFRDLSWETTKTANIGVDFSIKNRLLDASIDVYRKITDDILLPSPVPGTVGTDRNGPAINAGRVQNTGVELTLSHRNAVSKDFSYGISANASYNKNEILDLTDAFSEYSTDYRIGDPLGAVYGYKADGIISSDAELQAYKQAITSGADPNTSLGDIKYVDVNGDGKLDFKDQVVIAETVPRINWGLRLSAEYKNFDFQAFFQGVGKTKQYRSTDLFGNYSWIPQEATDAWSPENTDGSYPRVLLYGQQTYFRNFNTTSSFWAFNAAYLRLKDVQLGYNLPLKEQNFIKKMRIYVKGTNVLTVSDFRPGFDPESSGLGIPPLKTFSMGLNVNF